MGVTTGCNKNLIAEHSIAITSVWVARFRLVIRHPYRRGAVFLMSVLAGRRRSFNFYCVIKNVYEFMPEYFDTRTNLRLDVILKYMRAVSHCHDAVVIRHHLPVDKIVV